MGEKCSLIQNLQDVRQCHVVNFEITPTHKFKIYNMKVPLIVYQYFSFNSVSHKRLMYCTSCISASTFRNKSKIFLPKNVKKKLSIFILKILQRCLNALCWFLRFPSISDIYDWYFYFSFITCRRSIYML